MGGILSSSYFLFHLDKIIILKITKGFILCLCFKISIINSIKQDESLVALRWAKFQEF